MKTEVIVFLGHTSTVVHIDERTQKIANAINKVLYELHDYAWDNKLKRYVTDRRYFKLDKELGLVVIPKAYTEKLLESLKEHNIKFTIDKVQDIPVKNINASMLPGWVDKPEQVGPIRHLTDRKSSMKYLALQAGKGKTYSSTKSAIILDEPFMVITSRLVSQWVESVKSQTNLTDDDIFIIKGSPSVEEIIKKNLKPKCIIASLETMRNLCSNNNSIVTVDDLCYHVGIGTKIVDECHENFHAITMIDLSMNIRNNIYLTATFMRTNPSTNKIFNMIFTKEERYGEENYEKYTDVKMFAYASYTPDKYVRMSGSYNHHKYEAFLLRKEANVHWFCSHVLKRVIEERYIKIKKPGQKLLIILSRTDSIYKVVEKLRTLYPDLRVEPFTQSESTDNLEADIIISTPGSAGTGRHIDNLVSMICTISMAAPGKLIQLLGRLRKLKDSTVYYSDLYNESSSDHVRHAEERVSLFRKLSASFSTSKL